MIRSSSRIVVKGPLDVRFCIERMDTTKTQSEAIRMAACCSNSPYRLCISNAEDKSFQLTDAATVDFGGATEITFDVWQGNINGPSLLSYSLTGGEITLPSDNVISFSIPNAESAALPKGTHYSEIWVTTSGGDQIGARGNLTVYDTRKFD